MTTYLPRTAGLLVTSSAIGSKNLRTFLRDPQAVVPTVLQGVLFLLLFRYVFAGAIVSGELPYIDYMAPGIVTAATLFAATRTAVDVAQEQAAGFTDRVLSLPTHRPGITLGRLVAHTTVVTAAAASTLAAAIATGFRPHAPAPQLVIAGLLIVLYAVSFTALFMALGSFASGPASAGSFAFLAMPLTFFSSAFVPTDTMPSSLAAIAEAQPVTPMIDAIRTLTQSDIIGRDTASIVLAVAWAIALAATSLLVSAWRTTRKNARAGTA